MAKLGRPSEYTKEIGNDICEHISNGQSLRSFCEREGYPAKNTVLRWLRNNEDFRTQYALSRKSAIEVMADEIIDIADDAEKVVRKGAEKKSGAFAQTQRLRIDTRKWVMSKLLPKKYGDKVDITSDGKAIKGNTIVFEDFRDEAKRK